MPQLQSANAAALPVDELAALNREDARRELVAECRRLITDTEALFERAKSLSGEAYALARGELDRKLVELRRRYDTLADDAVLTAERARVSADRYVRENPWQATAFAAAAGALIGMVIARR